MFTGKLPLTRSLLFSNTSLFLSVVDLNEELTALDGHHVLTQAQFINHCLEVIVGMYPPGVKVDLVGHSMGGIVARLAYPTHINTLVTFSTPHASPPVPIDPVLSDLYATPSPAITIISIAGGARDTTIHSETAVVDHGLTVFTTSIPGVWTSLGHNEILTCRALLQRVVSGLVQDTLKDVLTLGDSPTPPGKDEKQ
jgi:pimeloyl-ACP methyl ester carboxylesterase